MSNQADLTFEAEWKNYMSKVRQYNSKQRVQILHLTINAFQGILAGFPAPRPEGDDTIVSPSQAAKKILSDVENFISARLYQLGFGKDIFQRFDPHNTHSVTAQEFRASCALVGIGLNQQEIDTLVLKYDSKGDGSINYEDFWKYLEARREAPKSTAQDAFSLTALNRKNATGKELSDLLHTLPDSVGDRLARGLKAMRDAMYQKSSNFHGFFTNMQNENKQVCVADIIPAQLKKLGFPDHLCSDEELFDAANKHSLKNPGYFTYSEFLAFFTGHEAIPAEPVTDPIATISDNPSFMNCLLKVNNSNLRKFFKELDTDLDGLISTDQLANGLIEHGLAPSLARDPLFHTFLETFSKRKQGFFGYAEFIKLIHTRTQSGVGQTQISGQPLQSHSPVPVPEDHSPSQTIELIVKTLRSTNVSVESIFSQYDSNDDSKLDESEFFQAVCALGFAITQPTSKGLFAALDTNNNGFIEINEFARLIVNPHKNPKLSTRVRHAPGGESSIAMGSYSSENGSDDATPRRPAVRQFEHKPHVDITNPQPLSKEEQTQQTQQTPRRRNIPGAGERTLDIGLSSAQEPAKEVPPPSPSAANGSSTARVPPGGKSSIDFVNDHGGVSSRRSAIPPGGKSDPNLTKFDPSAPAPSVANPRPFTAGGQTSISLADQPQPLPTPTSVRPLAHPMQSPGGNTTISFNQNDSEVYRPASRITASPGGNSTLDLSFPDLPASPRSAPAPIVKRAQDETKIDLSFDPQADVDAGKRVRKASELAPRAPRVQLTHSAVRQDDDLEGEHGMSTHRTRKHVEGVKASVAIGSDAGQQLLSSYEEQPEEVDPQLIARLSAAVYTHSQRLRHTFQEFNHNAQTATLSRDNFQSGAAKLGVDISKAQLDALFKRFDGDQDGEISYSEFVRMLATK